MKDKYSYDPRWDSIAREWIQDAGMPDHIVEKYFRDLAQSLQDRAEDFTSSDIPDAERLAEEAAYDAHINRQIDEARGK
jgi:hypothetical protein